MPVERRNILENLLLAGFALATQPIAASTVTTPSSGLTTTFTKLPASGLPLFVARPSNNNGPMPVVIVVQEIFGVHEHIQDLCRRLAQAGFLAVAPELYFREGDPRTISDIPTLLKDIVARVPDSQVMQDIDDSIDWAITHGGDRNKLNLTGFCWGGRIAWLFAAHSKRLKRAAPWYGRLMGQTTPLTPRFPIDIVAELHCPVLGFYGGKDQGISLESVEKMRSALRQAPANADIIVYPESQHGFNADYRPSFDAAAANDAWQKMLAFFVR